MIRPLSVYHDGRFIGYLVPREPRNLICHPDFFDTLSFRGNAVKEREVALRHRLGLKAVQAWRRPKEVSNETSSRPQG